MCILDNILLYLNNTKKTQKELTTYLKISQNVFTDWKAGRNKSYKKYLPQIADFFNISVDELIGKEITSKQYDYNLNEFEQCIINELRKLPSCQQDKVMNYINFLLIDEQMEASVRASAKDAV